MQQKKILFLLGITRPASPQRMSLNHCALLYISLYLSSFFFFFFLVLLPAEQHCCWIILSLSPARVWDWVKTHTVRRKLHSWSLVQEPWGKYSMFTMMTSTHVYETNKITRLGFSSGWRKRLRVRMCEGEKREKERLYGFHVSVAVIFSVMREDWLWTI